MLGERLHTWRPAAFPKTRRCWDEIKHKYRAKHGLCSEGLISLGRCWEAGRKRKKDFAEVLQ